MEALLQEISQRARYVLKSRGYHVLKSRGYHRPSYVGYDDWAMGIRVDLPVYGLPEVFEVWMTMPLTKHVASYRERNGQAPESALLISPEDVDLMLQHLRGLMVLDDLSQT